jgi:hypothetical protein
MMSPRVFHLPPVVASTWHWWLSELGGMVPERYRLRQSSRPRSRVLPGKSSVTVERIVDGQGERHVDTRVLENLDEAAWAELGYLIGETRCELVLSAPDVHIVNLILPTAARSRLRAAVTLRLDDLAPLDPHLLIWDAVVTTQDARGLHVAVVMARASRIASLVELFQSREVLVPEIIAELDGRSISLRRGNDGSQTPERRNDRRAWAIAAGLIASAPLTTFIAAKIMTSVNETHVAAAEDSVRPKIEAEGRFRREELVRRTLLPVLAQPSVSATIENLANVLPKTTFAQSVGLAVDRGLTFVVDTSDPEALADTLSVAGTLRGAHIKDETVSSPKQMRITYSARLR